MNWLQIVNRARRECGATGAQLTSLDEGTLTSEGLRFKDWTNDAWLDLQGDMATWNWRLADFTVTTIVGQQEYTIATDFADLKPGSTRVYLASAGTTDEQFLPVIDYDLWRDNYQMASARAATGRPGFAAVHPQTRGLLLSPLPDAVYTVVGQYWRAPAYFSTAADTPLNSGLPEWLHMLIVYDTMMRYASFEAAPEVLERGRREYRKLMARALDWGMPQIQAGPTLGE